MVMDDTTRARDGGAGGEPVANRLFDLGEAAAGSEPTVSGSARLRYANRQQVEMRMCALDALIPEDHPVRTVWAYVERLDLGELLAKIKAIEGRAGASATDPRILLTLWLYATLRGIGSARELDRRCQEEIAFEWICGGVTVNYHTLADFRVDHVEVLDRLLTNGVAVLLEQGLVSMERVAQDGMKGRASAGAGSFRPRPPLGPVRSGAVPGRGQSSGKGSQEGIEDGPGRGPTPTRSSPPAGGSGSRETVASSFGPVAADRGEQEGQGSRVDDRS